MANTETASRGPNTDADGVGRRADVKSIGPATPRAIWLSPVFIVLVIGTLAIVPVAFLSDQVYRLLWRTPKSVPIETLVLFYCGVMAFAFGALIAASVPARAYWHRVPSSWPDFDDQTRKILERASTVLAALVLVGYAGFVVVIARAGISVTELFSGSPDVKEAIGTVPGVTTLTQLGMASVVVSGLLLAERYSRSELLKVLLVVGLGITRAYINSERLAVVELAVPLLVIFSAKLSTQSPVRRRIAQLLPVVFVLVVLVVFGISEYFRSWPFYRTHGSGSYVEFVLSRFSGYYATAINNGYLNLAHMDWPNRIPYATLAAFWTAPGIETMNLYERLGGHIPPESREVDSSMFISMLERYANPEFNSESGYSDPFLDYGLVGGIAYFVLAGLLIGFLYRGFRNGRVFGLLLYPFAFIGLLELPRYIYWSYGRAVYTWLALAIIIVVIARMTARSRRS